MYIEGFLLHMPRHCRVLTCGGVGCWSRCTASQLVRDEEGDDSTSNHPPKKRGNLSATLDQELEARLPPGQPGRPKGTTNYEWTPETDKLLVELCARSGTTKAKRLVGRRIQEDRPAGAAPRPDSVRKAVERRMAKLGICAGQKRSKPDTREVKPWTECQTKTLLGALGADANIKSIAIRTGHSVKSVRAKIARLDYRWTKFLDRRFTRPTLLLTSFM